MASSPIDPVPSMVPIRPLTGQASCGVFICREDKPFEINRVADGGDLPFEASDIPDLAAIEIENFDQKIHEAGALPLTAGGALCGLVC